MKKPAKMPDLSKFSDDDLQRLRVHVALTIEQRYLLAQLPALKARLRQSIQTHAQVDWSKVGNLSPVSVDRIVTLETVKTVPEYAELLRELSAELGVNLSFVSAKSWHKDDRNESVNVDVAYVKFENVTPVADSGSVPAGVVQQAGKLRGSSLPGLRR